MALDIPVQYDLGVHFPGLAGQYQDEGSTAALVGELGDNYSVYHAWLAGQLAGLTLTDPDNGTYTLHVTGTARLNGTGP